MDIKETVEGILSGKDVKESLGLVEGVTTSEASVVDINESVDSKAVMKALKKLKPEFTGDELEKVLKSVVKDADSREAVYAYLLEVEEEDGIVSSFLSGDIPEKALKMALDSFIKDVLNEGVLVTESAQGALAKKVVGLLKKLTAYEFTGDELEDALEKAKVPEDDFDGLYDFLTEIEEEDGRVSAFIDGEIKASELEEDIEDYLTSTIDEDVDTEDASDLLEGNQNVAKALAKEVKKLKAGFDFDDLENAFDKAKVPDSVYDELFNTLAEIEEEENYVSDYIDGKHDEKDFVKRVLSIID